MTTEMQEIAITEDKPLLTGQADAKVRHTHTSLMSAQTQKRMNITHMSTPPHTHTQSEMYNRERVWLFLKRS